MAFLVMDLSKPINWLKVFSSLDVAEAKVQIGTCKTIFFQKQDLRLVLVRGHNNKWYACQDNCPHRGVTLGTGSVNEANEIRCSLHDYSWSLLNGMETTGYGCSPVKLYPVKTDEQGLWVGVVS